MAGPETYSAWHRHNAPIWAECRAAVEGGRAVRALGEAIVPKPPGMDLDEYDGYLARALYVNAVQRTVDSMVGLIMRKPAQVEAPDALMEMTDYIDGRGSRLEDFVRMAVGEVLEVGGGLAVVDHPERPEGVLTAAQERALGLRPVVSWYPLESVMEWRTSIVNGNEEIAFLKVSETYQVAKDEWTVEDHRQVRVYDMEGGVRVRVFRETEDGRWALHSEARPTGKTAQPLSYIPAVFFGPVRNAPGKPPLSDLIEVNFSHYRNSADREHGLHFTGLPTPYVSGAKPDEIDTLSLGSSVGHVFEDAAAKIQFATLDGAGLGALKESMAEKIEAMAKLGARMLAPESAQRESGTALELRQNGENSALSILADSVSRSVVLVLETLAEWSGIQGDVAYSLNTEFLPGKMTAQEIVALMQAWQGGALSSPELFDQFKSGGIIRDDMTYEEHEAELSGFDNLPNGSAEGA